MALETELLLDEIDTISVDNVCECAGLERKASSLSPAASIMQTISMNQGVDNVRVCVWVCRLRAEGIQHEPCSFRAAPARGIPPAAAHTPKLIFHHQDLKRQAHAEFFVLIHNNN